MAMNVAEILNFDFDTRKRFRFDVSKLPGLSITIEGDDFLLKDMSLSGLSFYNGLTEILIGAEFECFVKMNNDEIRIVLKLVDKFEERHGCEIVQNLNQYEHFCQQYLSKMAPNQY
jgi:hypothetical protein